MQEITQAFGEDVEKIGKGDYEDWKDKAYNGLAGIILMDQFTRYYKNTWFGSKWGVLAQVKLFHRNIYRGTPKMYSLDSKCFQLASYFVVR